MIPIVRSAAAAPIALRLGFLTRGFLTRQATSLTDLELILLLGFEHAAAFLLPPEYPTADPDAGAKQYFGIEQDRGCPVVARGVYLFASFV